MRQAVYTTLRIGLYFNLTDYFRKHNNGALTFKQMVGASIIAGGVGSFIGNPFDLALIRMQGDMRLPYEERRNYKNIADALVRIPSEEGVKALWKGASPTITRALCVNVAMLATYDEAK